MPAVKDDIAYDEVCMRYSYDPETGKLYSKIHNRRRASHDPNQPLREIRCACGGGYLQVNIKQSYYKAHRVAWLLHYGEWPKGEVDHIDGNPKNNAIANLRLVSHAQNSKNRKLNSNNSSGVKGVSWFPKSRMWRAYISVDNQWRSLGYFKNKDEAIQARQLAEAELHKSFTRRPHTNG